MLSFILHKQMAKAKGQTPLSQLAFWEQLVLVMAELGAQSNLTNITIPPNQGERHYPTHMPKKELQALHKTQGYKNCEMPVCFLFLGREGLLQRLSRHAQATQEHKNAICK